MNLIRDCYMKAKEWDCDHFVILGNFQAFSDSFQTVEFFSKLTL